MYDHSAVLVAAGILCLTMHTKPQALPDEGDVVLVGAAAHQAGGEEAVVHLPSVLASPGRSSGVCRMVVRYSGIAQDPPRR